MTAKHPTSEVETLNETISRAAKDWTEQDLNAIVAGLRLQRERWNIAQATGSKKRIQSKSINAPDKPPKVKKPRSKAAMLAAGLKRIRL